MIIDKECPQKWPAEYIWADERLKEFAGQRLCDGHYHYRVDVNPNTGRPILLVQYVCPKSDWAAGLDNLLADAQTFDSFDPKYQEAAYAKMLKWTQTFSPKRSRSVILMGPWGTGKTHLAMAAYHDLRRQGYRTFKLTAEKLMGLFLASEPTTEYKEEHEQARQTLRKITEADLVVIDDLGGQSVKPEGDYFVSKLKVLIDELTGPFILTTNSTQEQLAERYSPAVLSRLLHDTMVVPMPGEDYRRRKAKKA